MCIRDRATPLLERLAGLNTSAKEARLVELLRSRPDGKALIFATHRDTIDRLTTVLTSAGIAHVVFLSLIHI